MTDSQLFDCAYFSIVGKTFQDVVRNGKGHPDGMALLL